jgi:hypothetical protein
MYRFIIILSLVFIILTLVKGFLKKTIIKHSQKDIHNSGFNSKIKYDKNDKNSETGEKDENIVDAKFEELK